MMDLFTWVIELVYRVAEMLGMSVPVPVPDHVPAPEAMPIIRPEPFPIPDWYVCANPIDAIKCLLDPNCFFLLIS